jgi:hypothetical protein
LESSSDIALKGAENLIPISEEHTDFLENSAATQRKHMTAHNVHEYNTDLNLIEAEDIQAHPAKMFDFVGS